MEENQHRYLYYGATALVIIVAAVFANSLGNDFVFDDRDLVVHLIKVGAFEDPLRLFTRPEPVTLLATASGAQHLRWRKVQHAVAHCEGPERIAMEWWRDEQGHALTRDYFRVESREGVRVWLYRQGLFDERFFNEGSPPTWFLHGVFA